MENTKLNRVFDQVKLSREREEAMLADLLCEKKEKRPMRKNRKLTAIFSVAAAMLLTLCAFAIAAAVEPELLSYLGAEPENETLLYPSAVPLNMEKTSNGSTLRLRQVLADRCNVMLLMDLTAPEGTVLSEDFYKMNDFQWAFDPSGKEINSSWGTGWTLMEDEGPADNKLTLLMTLQSSSHDVNLLGAKIKFRFEGLFKDNICEQEVLQGSWNFTVRLSEEDSGIFCPVSLPLAIDGHTVHLTSIYVSPISVMVDLAEGEESLREVKDAIWEDKERGVALLAEDGTRVEMQEGEYTLVLSYYSLDREGETGRLLFSPEKIIDPATIKAVELFGQTVRLS